MKSLIGKINKVFWRNRGEILMEAIVSILLLSILLTIIITMIQTSRNITANSMEDARALQGLLSDLTQPDVPIFGGGNIRFRAPSLLPEIEIDSTHYIHLHNIDNIVAFFPGEIATVIN